MAKQLASITKTLKDYSGTFKNGTIVAATAAIEQISTVAGYRCPCVSLTQLSADCTNTTRGSQCTHLLNYGYGLSFILAPAVALFVAGVAGRPRFWKTFTGCFVKTQRFYREWDDVFQTLVAVIGRAFISPTTWIAIALLDGRYLACAITPLPYDVDHPFAQYSTCEVVAINPSARVSDSFNKNRGLSQLIGWILVATLAVVGIIAYSMIECTSPLTYYHAKYYKLYRSHEEAEFQDEMDQKAKKDAEYNVRKFMKERRSKELWDQISSVYDFHRDKKRLALYSNLHEWVLKEEAKAKSASNPPTVSLTNPSLEATSNIDPGSMTSGDTRVSEV